MKLSKGRKIAMSIGFTFIVIFLAIIIAGNIILYSFEDTITSYLCPPIVDEEAAAEARAAGQELSNQIVQEACVLTKNEDNALPLDPDSDTKVNVFGWTSTDWVYGGSGSGQVVNPGNAAEVANTTSLLGALTAYGITYNTELENFYKKYHDPIGDKQSIYVYQQTFYRLCEPTIADYSNSAYGSGRVLENAKSFSDVALVVLSRRAGETEDPTRVQYKEGRSTDTTRTYLEITTEEEELLTYVGSHFGRVIVIVNSTNVIKLGFLDTIPGLDACLVVGATGTHGSLGVPAVLYGLAKADPDSEDEDTEISPSGHFVDTYAYEFESNINYHYTGDEGVGHYTGASGQYPEGINRNAGEQYTTATYVDYVEGIYVGYKWYETAYAMGLWDSVNKPYGTGYDGIVQYPFGYGLSYTSFTWEVLSFTVDDEDALGGNKQFDKDSKISLAVKVTNVGEQYSGRDVVEIYLTPPYTPGGIEKSFVSLVGFAKTRNLAPGESQDITITLDPYDFMSYDCYDANRNGYTGYELEAGTYQIKLMKDSHRVNTVTVGETEKEGVLEIKVAETQLVDKDKYTGNKVENRFTGSSAVETVSIDGKDASVPVEYITRLHFPDPFTFARTPDRAMTTAEKKYNLYTAADATAWNNAATDIVGNNVDRSAVRWSSGGSQKVYDGGKLTELGMKLAQDYNAPEWESLLDQVSISEAISLAENGAFNNAAVNSIGKPKLSDYDGPSQVRSFNAGNDKGTGFPCAATMCQTWNTSIMYSFGLNYGKEMSALGVDGAYAFGCNLHRNPFQGRNYEYLSEDGFMSAAMLTQEVRGLKNMGKYTYLKHLAVAETEHDREAMYTFLTEQSFREIYLKPFQKSIQVGGCIGLMSSYNRIGNVWAGGCEALITGVVRYEWGFNGTIVTDYADHPQYMNGDQAVRAGSCISMNAKFHYNTVNESAINANPRLAHRMRDIVHQTTYAFINAKYTNLTYNESDDVEQFFSSSAMRSWTWWKPLLASITIFVAVGCALGAYFLIVPRHVITGKVKVPATGKRKKGKGGDEPKDEPVNNSVALCANCGAELAPDDIFCGECGTPVSPPQEPAGDTAAPTDEPLAFCMNCGARLAPDELFCGECGTPVPKPEEPAPRPVAEPVPEAAEIVEAEPEPAPEASEDPAAPEAAPVAEEPVKAEPEAENTEAHAQEEKKPAKKPAAKKTASSGASAGKKSTSGSSAGKKKPAAKKAAADNAVGGDDNA